MSPAFLKISFGKMPASSHSSAWGANSSSQNLMTALPNFDFVFINSSINGGVWWSDPPGGKDNPTTDEDWANTSLTYIENYINNINSNSKIFIKIDIEGYDINAVYGAKNIIIRPLMISKDNDS